MDASFNLLGCVTREASSEEKPCVGVNDWCLEASEVYEYGLSLNNSLYRSRVLLPMKLLHSMRLSEMGYVEACVAYLEELRESVRASRVTNESFIQQLELLENRVRQSEKEWECVECVTRRQVAGKGGFLSQLFTVVDKGINSFMTAVEEKEEVGVSSASSVPSVPAMPVMPAMPSAPVAPVMPSVPAMPPVPSMPSAPVAPAMPAASSAPAMPAMPAMPAAPAFTKPAARAQHPHGNRHARNSLPKPFVPYTPPESVLQPAQPQPLQPLQPVQPQPIQPIQPVQPLQPFQPTQPFQPVQPAQPAQPIQPPQPTPPSEPAQPPKPSPTPAPSKPAQPAQPPKPSKPAEPPKPKEEEKSSSWSLFGSLFRRSDSSKKVYKVELPKNEAKPYYDEVKKKWIIPGVEEEEEKAPLPPPPPMEPAPQPQPEPEPEPEPEPQAAPPMPAIKPFVPAAVAEEKEETSQEPPKTGRRRFGPM